MSKTIENGVVQMSFDNRNFESNVKQSMATLDSLKKSLDMSKSSKSLTDVGRAANSIDFSRLESNVRMLARRFSVLGIVGMTAITNITNRLIDGVAGITSKVVDLIKTGGISRAMNIEQAKFQLNGLKVAWENIKDDIDYAVSGTAYGLDAAAKAASQLVASGVKFGETSSEMRDALRGISGVAAMTNREYSDIANIFTTVAGQGKLMTMQMRQLEASGLNVAATMAEQMNTTEAAVRDMVTNGEIDFRKFSKAMDDAFGEHAKDANNTFTGSLSNIKSALSRIGEGFVEPLIRNRKNTEDEAKNLINIFNQLRLIGDGAKLALAPIYEVYTPAVEKAFNNLYQYMEKFSLFSFETDEEGKSFKKLTAAGENLREIFVSIWEGGTLIGGALYDNLALIGEAFNAIFGDKPKTNIASIISSLSDFISSILAPADAQMPYIVRSLKGIFAVLDMIRTSLGLLFRFIGSPIEWLTRVLGDGLLVIFSQIGDKLVELNEKFQAWAAVVSVPGGALDKLRAKIVGFLSSIQLLDKSFEFPAIRRAKDIFTVFIGVLDRVRLAAGAAFNQFRINNNILDTFSDILSVLLSGVKQFGEGIGNIVAQFVQGIKDAFTKAEYNGLADAIHAAWGGTGLFFILKTFTTLGRNIQYAAENLGRGFDIILGNLQSLGKIADIPNNLRSNLLALTRDIKADMLYRIAKSIALIAGSLFLISLIDSEKLSVAMFAVSGMLFALAKTAEYLEKVFRKDPFTTLRNSLGGFLDATSEARKYSLMVSIAAGVAIMAVALSALSKLNWDQLAVGITGMTVLIIELSYMMSYLDKNVGTLKKGEKSKSIMQIVAVAVAIKILASAIEDLSTIPFEALAAGVISVTALLFAMGYMLKVIGHIEQETQRNGRNRKTSLSATLLPNGLVTSLIALAASIKIIAWAVKDLGGMDKLQLANGLAAAGGILIALAAFYRIVGHAKITSLTSSQNILPKDMVLSLVALAASLKIIARVVEDLSTLTWDQLAIGLTGMGVMVMAITALFSSLSGVKVGEENTSMLKVSAAIIIFAAAMKLLAPVLLKFGNMSLEAIGKSLITFAISLNIIINTIDLLKGSEVTLLSLGGAIALIGIGVGLLGAGLVAAGAGLVAIAGGLAALVAAVYGSREMIILSLQHILLSFVNLIPEILKGLTAQLSAFGDFFVEILVVLSKSLLSVAKVYAETFFESIIMALDMLQSYLPQIVEKFMEVFTMAIPMAHQYLPEVVSEIALLLTEIFDSVMEKVDFDVSKLVTVIGILSGVFIGLARIKKDLMEGAKTLAAMAGALAALVVVISVFNAMGIDAALPMISSLSVLLLSLGATARLVGGMDVGAAAKGALALSAFIGILGGVVLLLGGIGQIPGVKWLLDEGAIVMEGIGKAIGSLVGGLVEGTLSTMSNALPIIGENLGKFMEKALPFFEGVKDFNSDSAMAIAALAGAMVLITGSEIVDGIKRFVTGGQSSIVTFGEKLEEFAPHFVNYYNAIKDVKGDVVKDSAEAALALAEFASKIPNEGGWVGKVLGENDIAVFGAKLKEFAPDFAEYCRIISEADIDTEAVEASAKAASSLSEFASHLPNEGGWISKITGDNDIAVFGEKLAEFGGYFVEYANAVGDENINYEIVEKSAAAAGALAALADNLPENNGWWQKLAGAKMDLGDFGKSLGDLASGLSDFDTGVANIKMDQFNGAIEGLSYLIDSVIKIGAATGTNMASFATGLGALGQASIDEFVRAFDTSKIKVETAVKVLLFYAQQELEQVKHKEPYYKAARAFIEEMTAAVREKGVDLYKAVSTIALSGAGDKGAKSIDVYEAYQDAGVYVVRGFCEGINNSLGEAYKAGTKLGKAALEAAKEALDEHSPSVEFEEVGSYAGEGFVNGLEKYVELSYDAGKEVADASMDGAIDGLNARGAEFDDVLKEVTLNSIVHNTEQSKDAIERAMAEMNDSMRARVDAEMWRLVPSGMSDIERYMSGVAMATGKTWRDVINGIDLSDNNQVMEVERRMSYFMQYFNTLDSETQNNINSLAQMYQVQDDVNSQLNALLQARREYMKYEEQQYKMTIDTTLATDIAIQKQNDLAAAAANATEASLDAAQIATQTTVSSNGDVISSDNERQYKEAGVKLIEALAAGIYEGRDILFLNTKQVLEEAIDEFSAVFANVANEVFMNQQKDNNPEYLHSGRNMAEMLIKGAMELSEKFKKSVKNIALYGVEGARSSYDGWYKMGRYLMDGFIAGINAQIDAILAAVAAMAEMARQHAADIMGVASPSKEFYWIGEMCGLGLINAFKDSVSTVGAAADEMGVSALDGLREAISAANDMLPEDDLMPVITPIIDLTNVKSGIANLSKMLSNGRTMEIAASVNATRKANESTSDNNQNGQNGGETINNYTFEQNNYSPKALSQIDIYRQSKNLFGQMRGATT